MLVALPNAYGDAATNMAIDAALLEGLPEGLAIFRHYGWTEPAVTFGYAQKFKEVKQSVGDGVSFCRRLTGGGIVDHRNDWTYAIAAEASLPIAGTAATDVYEYIHRAIGRTLETRGIDYKLAPCPRHCSQTPSPNTQPDHCFLKPAANDVIRRDGVKIAGAAMKRNRKGLLIQGSLDRSALPDSFEFANFQEDLLTRIAQGLGIQLGTLEDFRPLFDSERIEKAKQRFLSDEWNHRR